MDSSHTNNLSDLPYIAGQELKSLEKERTEDSSENEEIGSVALEDILIDSESDDEFTPLRIKEEVNKTYVYNEPVEEEKKVVSKETPQYNCNEEFLSVTETPGFTPTPLFEKQEVMDKELFHDPLEIVDRYETLSRATEVLTEFTRPIEEVMSKNSLSVHRMIYSQLRTIRISLGSTEHERNLGRPSCICVTLHHINSTREIITTLEHH